MRKRFAPSAKAIILTTPASQHREACRLEPLLPAAFRPRSLAGPRLRGKAFPSHPIVSKICYPRGYASLLDFATCKG
jgi:hypothetical protein